MMDTRTKKRSFFTDIWRKVIALFLAIFAWYAIHKQLVEGLPVISMKVPLQIECADKQVILPEKTMPYSYRSRRSGHPPLFGCFPGGLSGAGILPGGL